jgi:hypothetical protein
MAVPEKRDSILGNKNYPTMERHSSRTLELSEEQNCVKRVELAAELCQALNKEAEERQREPGAPATPRIPDAGTCPSVGRRRVQSRLHSGVMH